MMKHLILLISTSFLLSVQAEAKWVRFTVDMTGQTINPNGVHLTGNFQELAGFPGGDWNSGTITMAPVSGGNLFFVTVKIPAFQKYEYKIVNGDQFYEAEFVPEHSRVGYDFNDNRWFYLDSLSADTTVLPAILFGGNAPAGQKMMRIYVDMSQQPTVEKVYPSGSFNGFSTTANRMYRFTENLYETMVYSAPGMQTWKYVIPSGEENLNGNCTNIDGRRYFDLQTDTLLDKPCFQSCLSCQVSVEGSVASTTHNLQVRSEDNFVVVRSAQAGTIRIVDIKGRLILNGQSVNEGETWIPLRETGLFLIQFLTENEASGITERLIKL